MRKLEEGGGIEPLTLPRCHPSFRGSLPDRSGGTFPVILAEGAGIEPARPLGDHPSSSRAHYHSANLPASSATKIDLSAGGDGRHRTDALPLAGRVLSRTELHPHAAGSSLRFHPHLPRGQQPPRARRAMRIGARGTGSNLRPARYECAALPSELHGRERLSLSIPWAALYRAWPCTQRGGVSDG